MSLLNDEDPEEIADKVASSAFRNITGSIIDTHTAVVVLSIAGAAEIGGLVMVRLGRFEVIGALEHSDLDVWIYCAIGAFVVGFLCLFPTYFLINERWPRPEAPFMVWPISITAGIANIVLFYVLIFGFRL